MKLAFLAAVALFASSIVRAQVEGKVIYGEDDRLDLYQVKDARVLELADSTVALFSYRDVAISSGVATLRLSNYGLERGLCPEERFYDQKNGAFCSGSLVAPDVVMTAGHCIEKDSCDSVKFVFGFGIKKEGVSTPEEVAASEVYGCKEVVGREQLGKGADWALVRLDRPVTNHKPLALNRTEPIANSAPLFVIGHPVGLPTKVAGGAAVRDASGDGFFVANLDTYGGNSGSAVFNARTLLVEGVLVRGEVDFVYKDGRDCRVSNRCPDDGCRGEDVTKISSVLPHLPGTSTAAARLAPVGASVAGLIERASFDGTR